MLKSIHKVPIRKIEVRKIQAFLKKIQSVFLPDLIQQFPNLTEVQHYFGLTFIECAELTAIV